MNVPLMKFGIERAFANRWLRLFWERLFQGECLLAPRCTAISYAESIRQEGSFVFLSSTYPEGFRAPDTSGAAHFLPGRHRGGGAPFGRKQRKEKQDFPGRNSWISHDRHQTSIHLLGWFPALRSKMLNTSAIRVSACFGPVDGAPSPIFFSLRAK